MNEFKKKIYLEREKNRIKIKEQVDIIDLAREMGYHVIPHGSQYRLAEHDSCVLYPKTNTYVRYSKNEKACDVINFLQEFCNMTFNEAYNFLLNKIDPSQDSYLQNNMKNQMKKLSPQQRTRSLLDQLNTCLDSNCRNAMAYLIKERKLDPDIVYDFLSKNLIKQQTNKFGTKNIVFLGYDENGMLAAAEYHSCSRNIKFKGDFKNCDYDYCWMYEPTVNSSSFAPAHDWHKPCIVTEAAIDRMALISMMKNNQLDPSVYNIDPAITALLQQANYDYKKFNWLSLGSTSHSAVIEILSDKFGIDTWILAPDNDDKGLAMIKKITDRKCANSTIYSLLPLDKDWDQDLINLSKPVEKLDNRLKTAQIKLNDNSSNIIPKAIYNLEK